MSNFAQIETYGNNGEYAIYVHIPFCKARCGYCAFSSCTNFDLRKDYFEVLCNEIAQTDVPQGVRIVTMFWGGGTPSSVGVQYLDMLHKALSAKFDLSHLQEFSVELNPESTTHELLMFLKGIGVTRLSFGLQSANDQTLKLIGRLHDYATFCSALKMAQSCGFDNINADLILGLPESRQSFHSTVQTVVQLPLQHISLYALEIHENTPFQKLCSQYAFSDDQLADMYDQALAVLQQAGFCRYEVSNFAKIGFESRHNLMYWTENRYFGFGAAASGFVGNSRYGNAFDIAQYIQSGATAKEYDDEISPAEEVAEFVMLGLRLAKGISLEIFSNRYHADFFQKFPNAQCLIARGFLCCDSGRIFVPADKFYVLNSILVELLPD